MTSIDTGLAAYRLFFVKKWHRALNEKEQAFPHRYRFSEARKLRTVADLTRLFVSEHTDFPSTEAYLSAYSLMGDALTGTRATVIYAEDDPVIPAAGFEGLPASLELVPSLYGGHCAFVQHPVAPSWADRYLVRHFADRLRPDPV